MRTSNAAAIGCAMVLGWIVGCALIAGLFKLFYGWIVPDILTGSVEQGLIVGTLSWATTAKIFVYILIMSLFYGGAKYGGNNN